MFIHPTGQLVSPLLMLRHAAVLALVVGTASLVTQQQSHAYVSLEVGCLALNIYHEARGESHDGQVAVAAVTLNQMHSASYPDTVCGVVWQPHQFSWARQRVHHTRRNPLAWASVLAVAERAYTAPWQLPLKRATHFHAREARPYWASSLRLVDEIGNHLFYAS